uniref:Pco129562 n=1 Tax=Arundo donax TaxID=35708 RepID=A0A0A9GL42_ARUDO
MIGSGTSPLLTSGPLVSSMMAITFPSVFCALYSFTKSITTWCDWWSPWDIFSRATFIPASASFQIISRVFVEGPMVQTILVFLLEFAAAA